MAVEYVNRKRDRYYLHERKTKKGNPSYFFSKKEDGVLVDSIPDGYEIYENPNAQVFLRKILPKIFTDEELSVVEDAVKKHSAAKHFVVDVKGNSIVVFLPDQDLDQLKTIFSGFVLPGSTKLDRIFEERTSYSPMMRFVLTDREKRKFDVERWCFLGSIDDWMYINSSNDLAKLAKRYCKHLGRESFYDLSFFN